MEKVATDSQLTNLSERRAWSPWFILLVTLLFSYIPGGILFALNYKRLGKPSKMFPAFASIIVLFFLHHLLAFFASNEILDIVFGARGPRVWTAVVGGLFVALQIKDFERFIASGGKKAGQVKPFIYSLIFAILYYLMIFSLPYLTAVGPAVRYVAQVEQADTLREQGRFSEAESLLLELQKEHPELYAAYYILALLYRDRGMTELARQQGRLALESIEQQLATTSFPPKLMKDKAAVEQLLRELEGTR